MAPIFTSFVSPTTNPYVLTLSMLKPFVSTYTFISKMATFLPSPAMHSVACGHSNRGLTRTASKVRGNLQETSEVDPRAGIPLYKPKSYQVLIANAAKALIYALDDGKTHLEIQFPPLPSSISSYKGSSDEFIDANIQLVLSLVRKLNEARGMTSRIVFPDNPEKRGASRVFHTTLELINGVSLGSLDEIQGGAVKSFFSSIRYTLDFDFEESGEGWFFSFSWINISN